MAHISTRQASQMCQRIGTALRAGVDIVPTLDRETRHGSPTYRRHASEIATRVRGGASLAEAMRQCDPFFPPLTCELVDVGEQTGNLESVLLRLGEHYQHLLRLRRAFLTGILWPAIQLVGAIVIIGLLILLFGVLGTSATVFGLSGVSGLRTYLLFVFGCAAVLFVLIRGLLRGWFGPGPTAVLMRLPVIGSTLQTMALARLAWTLSLALNAGIDARRAMRMALASTQRRYFTAHTEAAERVVERGGQFHEALAETGVFGEDFLTALENAEISGTETESLSRLSQDYQQRAETATMAFAVAASVMIWLLVAALIVYLIFHLFFSLYLNPIQEALEMTR